MIRWDTLLIGVEILVVIFLGFIPDSFPVQISQVAINFIASMQFNTFRQAQGTPMATTFATNHIRQIGIGLAKEIRHWNKSEGMKSQFPFAERILTALRFPFQCTMRSVISCGTNA